MWNLDMVLLMRAPFFLYVLMVRIRVLLIIIIYIYTTENIVLFCPAYIVMRLSIVMEN